MPEHEREEITDPVEELARERFGVASLRPWQRFVVGESLDTLLAPGEGPRARIVLLPTGAGKSLCFQLPALLAPGPTLVVYPLRALLADQERSLAARGIAAAVLRGGEGEEERERQERAARGGARIILATPEAAMVPRNRELLKEVGLSHLVVDEAHCVPEWGESFRPSYLELGPLIAELAPPLATAFTATASPRVTAAIERILFGGARVPVLAGDPDRPNVRYAVEECLSRTRSLVRAVGLSERPLIVFCGTRELAERTAALIRRRLPGTEARHYHAGLPKERRAEIEHWFRESKEGILTATCAYGMGIDKSDIRTVVHLLPPPSVEAYLQETGRAGRDGLPSRALLLLGPEERMTALGEERSALAEDTVIGGAMERCVAEHRGADDAPASGSEEALRTRKRAFTEAALGPRGEGRARHCLRASYLALLGKEAESCSGCGPCEGSGSGATEALLPLLERLRLHSGRLGDESIKAYLAGRPPRGEPDSAVPLLAGAGLLSEWREEEIEECVASAIKSGILRTRRLPLTRASSARIAMTRAGKRAIWELLREARTPIQRATMPAPGDATEEIRTLPYPEEDLLEAAPPAAS